MTIRDYLDEHNIFELSVFLQMVEEVARKVEKDPLTFFSNQ